jgi:hypothetical protein
MLLSLAFADEAFASTDLTGPEELFRLRVLPDSGEQRLPIKDEMAEVPLFRRLERTVQGFQVSEDAGATDTWLRESMAKLGAITGFELPVGPYCFRRGAGEALDNSSASPIRWDG